MNARLDIMSRGTSAGPPARRLDHDEGDEQDREHGKQEHHLGVAPAEVGHLVERDAAR